MPRLTEAARRVFEQVKAGADCVTVDHLTGEERLAVCQALGVEARGHWLTSAPYPAEAERQPARARARYIDVEALILERQDDFYEG